MPYDNFSWTLCGYDAILLLRTGEVEHLHTHVQGTKHSEIKFKPLVFPDNICFTQWKICV